MTLGDWLHFLNRSEASLCRVKASWQHRAPHYRLRFELERRLIEGSLELQDLPEAWDEACVIYFGRAPSVFDEGWMQDPHWATGLWGYLPAYSVADQLAGRFAVAFKDASALIRGLCDEELSLSGVESWLSARSG